jgi:WD40 repeat protein
VTSFRGSTGRISDIAINLENTLLAAVSYNGQLTVWNLQTAKVVKEQRGFSNGG